MCISSTSARSLCKDSTSCRLENEHHDRPCAPPERQLVRLRVASTHTSPSFPSHLDSHSRLDLECLIAPCFAKQPRPSDCPSRRPTPLVRAAPKKPPTDAVLIVRGPLQVRPRSGLLLYSDCLLLYIDSTTSRSPFLPTISVLDYRLLPLSPLILLSSDIDTFPSPPISLMPALRI